MGEKIRRTLNRGSVLKDVTAVSPGEARVDGNLVFMKGVIAWP